LSAIKLTAAGIQAEATGRGPDDEPAIFRVVPARGARLELRAAGNAAGEALAGLEAGDRVEVRVLPPLAVEREAEGGTWARRAVTVNNGDATLMLPGGEP